MTIADLGQRLPADGDRRFPDRHLLTLAAVVVRLNGHESSVGHKTTLWFLGELKTPQSKEFDQKVKPERYIVPITWPAQKGCKKCSPSGADKKYVRSHNPMLRVMLLPLTIHPPSDSRVHSVNSRAEVCFLPDLLSLWMAGESL